jgi:hypothetical protein
MNLMTQNWGKTYSTTLDQSAAALILNPSDFAIPARYSFKRIF